nr:hypothetical protein [Adlercreutzia muris]
MFESNAELTPLPSGEAKPRNTLEKVFETELSPRLKRNGPLDRVWYGRIKVHGSSPSTFRYRKSQIARRAPSDVETDGWAATSPNLSLPESSK